MTDSGSEQRDIRELAERLMTHPHPEGGIAAELFVGRMPETLEPSFPLPSGARLLGGRLQRLGGRPASFEAVLDAQGDPSALLDVYEQALLAAGWQLFSGFGPPQGGFVAAQMGDGRVLQKDGVGPILAISATASEGAPTDVRVRLDWESVRHMAMSPRGMPPGADLLPALRLPAGVGIHGLGGSGGNGRWTSEGTLQSDQPVAELEAHFAAQLARAGWTRERGGADDAMAWSAWQLPGHEGWRGVLLLVAAFGPGECFVSARVERSDLDETGVGYTRAFR